MSSERRGSLYLLPNTLGDVAPEAVIPAGTLDRAVAFAARDAEAARSSDPVVLLSPACASFDQFPNFEIRGSAFRELVRKLDGVEAVESIEESA